MGHGGAGGRIAWVRGRGVRALVGAWLVGGLAACGGSADTAAPDPAPVVNAVAATAVPVSGRIGLSGERLDQVVSFELGALPLAVLSQGAGEAVLGAPDQPASGRLELVYRDAAGTRRRATTAHQLTVYAPATVTAVQPAGGPPGTAVVVSGQGLQAVTQVQLGERLLLPLSVADGRVTLQIPADATSGPLTLITAYERVPALARLEVVAPLQVTGLRARVDPAGSRLTVQGRGLAQVQVLRVAGVDLVPTRRQDDLLEADAGPQLEGEVLLVAPYQTVSAGRWVRGADAVLTVDALWLAQQMAAPAGAVQRLVAGSPVLLKLDLGSAKAGVPSPAVELLALRAGAVVDRLALQGPDTVPSAAARYALDRSYRANVPGDWVVPGATWQLALSPAATGQVNQRIDLAPAIDPVPRLDLTLVPVVLDGVAPQLPGLDELRELLARTLPLGAPDALRVRVRAPWSVGTPGSAEDLLYRLNSVRLAEAPGELHLGIVPSTGLYALGVSGIAYRNDLVSLSYGSAWLAALVHDSRATDDPHLPFPWPSAAWTVTTVHELGHVFGRMHAPCSRPGGPVPLHTDPAYPYAGGTLGDAPLYDRVSGFFGAPLTPDGTALTDVMGYCEGVLFSDFNAVPLHEAMQAHARRRSAADRLALQALATRRVLQGLIEEGVVSWRPMDWQDAGEVLPDGLGDHELTVRTRSGVVHRVGFTPVPVSDATPAAAAFRVALPTDDAIERVEVRHAGVLLAQAGPLPQAQADMAAGATAAAATAVRVLQQAGQVVLVWPDAPGLRARLLHVDRQGVRRLVGQDLRGGQAVLDVGGLPDGGQWWLDLAGPWQVQRHVIPR